MTPSIAAPPARRALARTVVPLLLLLLVVPAGVAAAAGPDAPASGSPPAEGAPVTFAGGDGEQLSGFLALPAGKGPHPALVVIHEWWGLNDWVRDNARELARRGYVALAVDLYRGQVAEDRDLAHELSRGLGQERALADMRAALAYLRSRDDVDPKRVGSIGWCMGGGYSLALALAEPLQATVICYGRLVVDPERLRSIAGPVLGVFGETDRGIPAEEVRKFEGALGKAGVEATVTLYEGVGHAFLNPGNPSFQEATAGKAWDQIYGFLAEKLQSPAAD